MVERVGVMPCCRCGGATTCLNALGATSVALQAGADLPSILRAMRTFKGVKRRFQVQAEVGGITING